MLHGSFREDEEEEKKALPASLIGQSAQKSICLALSLTPCSLSLPLVNAIIISIVETEF